MVSSLWICVNNACQPSRVRNRMYMLYVRYETNTILLQPTMTECILIVGTTFIRIVPITINELHTAARRSMLTCVATHASHPARPPPTPSQHACMQSLMGDLGMITGGPGFFFSNLIFHAHRHRHFSWATNPRAGGRTAHKVMWVVRVVTQSAQTHEGR